MPNNPREANAELRKLAAMTREIFVSLCEEGFTEQQALAIIGHILAANSPGSG
jgi:hypothetical protein